jgi:hypothetical protein
MIFKKLFQRAQPKERKPTFRFDPQPDITAYELALLMPALIPLPFRDLAKTIEALPDACRRHIRDITDSEEVAGQLERKAKDEQSKAD